MPSLGKVKSVRVHFEISMLFAAVSIPIAIMDSHTAKIAFQPRNLLWAISSSLILRLTFVVMKK